MARKAWFRRGPCFEPAAIHAGSADPVAADGRFVAQGLVGSVPQGAVRLNAAGSEQLHRLELDAGLNGLLPHRFEAGVVELVDVGSEVVGLPIQSLGGPICHHAQMGVEYPGLQLGLGSGQSGIDGLELVHQPRPLPLDLGQGLLLGRPLAGQGSDDTVQTPRSHALSLRPSPR